jgi:predicted membrane channel-forming protein YqfA (hemolysin III family)
MRFNAPTQVFFFVSLVLVVLGLLSRLTPIQGLTPNSFWLVLVGYIVLVIGVVYRRR